ncbi:hypothetical protein [Blastococcus sp. SYSU DS0539]
MDSFAPHAETHWIVQPLVDAGLDLDDIRVLVTRLGFEAVVGGPRGVDARLLDVVGDRPHDVRAAWVETIDRMTTRPLPGC